MADATVQHWSGLCAMCRAVETVYGTDRKAALRKAGWVVRKSGEVCPRCAELDNLNANTALHGKLNEGKGR